MPGHDKKGNNKMPIAGKGMLLTSMDIDPEHEEDFNRWYDRDHLEERVAIAGFIEARRYVAEDGAPKYLFLYSTETIDVLNSPAYKARLANPSEWSKKTMARFKNMLRAVARITISRGKGRGAVLGIVRIRPASGGHETLREALRTALDPQSLDGVISMHVIESDPALSGPTTEIPAAAGAGAGDWFVLIDATDVTPAETAMRRVTDNIAFGPMVISSGIYRLLWDIAKADIS
jgi:hypothetical protein